MNKLKVDTFGMIIDKASVKKKKIVVVRIEFELKQLAEHIFG